MYHVCVTCTGKAVMYSCSGCALYTQPEQLKGHESKAPFVQPSLQLDSTVGLSNELGFH
jgi:hypothetical protein